MMASLTVRFVRSVLTGGPSVIRFGEFMLDAVLIAAAIEDVGVKISSAWSIEVGIGIDPLSWTP